MFKKLYCLIILLALSSPIPAEQTKAFIAICPDKISPGDAFVIHVQTPIKPTGLFQKRKIRFYETERGFKAITYVDINTKPGEYPFVLSSGELSSTYSINVKPKEFLVKNITLKSEKVFLSSQDEKRANEESALLKSIWNNVTPYPLWTENFMRPISDKITSPFGVKRIINQKKESRHRGTDYKGTIGTPIKAINSGVVSLTDNQFYGGNVVLIDHGLGLYSVYLHLSKTSVSTGEKIDKGDIIGLVGSTGRASGPHLHLSVKLDGESINPESLYDLDL